MLAGVIGDSNSTRPKSRFFAVMILNNVGDPEILAAGRVNHRIDEIEHRRGRPEASRQRQILQFELGFFDAGSKRLTRFAVAFGRGPLKAVNRLLEIADREDCPRFLLGRAPRPALKIIAQSTTISHCASLVSCASSTRIWSICRSSLNRTQSAIWLVPSKSAVRAYHVVEIDHARRMFALRILPANALPTSKALARRSA